jgi:hypothetical protein
MYAQVCTRLDIVFVVGMFGWYQTDPKMDHWKAAKKIVCYLQEYKDNMLTFKKSYNLAVIDHSDSDFSGFIDSKKYTSCYIFMLVVRPISWKSAKQSIIASSTMRAEFIACYVDTGQVIWLKDFIPGLQVIDNIVRPLTLLCDNETAIIFSENNKSSGASKWIDIKYLVVSVVLKNFLNLMICKTNYNLTSSMFETCDRNINQA